MFFFKQKTAYEMRISDWSSDVCSSDLLDQWLDDDRTDFMRMRFERAFHVPELPARVVFPAFSCATRIAVGRGHVDRLQQQRRVGVAIHARAAHRQRAERFAVVTVFERSEEHTSELQSLMRISYAVFCLKKKR